MDYRKLTKAQLIEILELKEKPVHVENPRTIYDYLKPYGSKKQEHFLVVLLNGALRIIGVKVVSIGLTNRCLVHPREVFSQAIEQMATSVVIAHNHPSGNLEPSSEDYDVTHRLKRAGELLGIQVLDHVIFSDSDYHSMAENGELL